MDDVDGSSRDNSTGQSSDNWSPAQHQQFDLTLPSTEDHRITTSRRRDVPPTGVVSCTWDERTESCLVTRDADLRRGQEGVWNLPEARGCHSNPTLCNSPQTDIYGGRGAAGSGGITSGVNGDLEWPKPVARLHPIPKAANSLAKVDANSRLKSQAIQAESEPRNVLYSHTVRSVALPSQGQCTQPKTAAPELAFPVFNSEPVDSGLIPNTKEHESAVLARPPSVLSAELNFLDLKSDTRSIEASDLDLRSQTHDLIDCHRSVTGSFVQQCSDADEAEDFQQSQWNIFEHQSHNPLECQSIDRAYPLHGFSHPLQNLIQRQQELLVARDDEILILKEANRRQSQFIEKVMGEKRLLETTVAEQARVIMSHGYQGAAREPVRLPLQGTSSSLDLQFYEAQLDAYKEDFENERKEKGLVQASANSLKSQLVTALAELKKLQEKLKTTEGELQRYRNPYGAAYEPYYPHSGPRSSQTERSASSSSTQPPSKTPLYRKPSDLETDRLRRGQMRSTNNIVGCTKTQQQLEQERKEHQRQNQLQILVS